MRKLLARCKRPVPDIELTITVNGETIIVTRYADVDSGQHRGIGFLFACQIWEKGDIWNGIDPRKLWPEMPTMECIIVYGVSSSPRVTIPKAFLKA